MNESTRVINELEKLLDNFPRHRLPEDKLCDIDSFAVFLRHPVNGALVRLPIERYAGFVEQAYEVRFVVHLPNELKELIHTIPVAPERKR